MHLLDHGFPAYTRRWFDENTGHEVRMLGERGNKNRVFLPYFLDWKHLADGRLLLNNRILDASTGEVIDLPKTMDRLHISTDGSRIYYWEKSSRSLVALTVPDLRKVVIGQVTDERFAGAHCVSCDERTLICCKNRELATKEIQPFGQNDPEVLWEFWDRPRCSELSAYDLKTGKLTSLVRTEGFAIIYVMPSPTDPTLVKFCHDRHEATCQRIWTVRTDGTEMRKVRPQDPGEVVTHDIWWPDGRYIAYKYLDRRQDSTLRKIPWSEYAPVPTRIGLSRPDGPEVYLSDPLESYHSHINVSRDGKLLSGEGTHDHSFAYAAAFSMDSTRINFIPQATIHTKYSPMGGQGLNADFTADGRWLLYQDTIEGEMHLCAVRVDVQER